MGESTTIRWEKDGDGIVLLTLDDPDQSANTMNRAFAESMAATVDRLEAEQGRDHGRRDHLGQEDVLRRRRPQRPQGGDEGRRARARRDGTDGQGPAAHAGDARRTGVAAINGAALGGGLEIALACHHRVAVDDPGVQMGFPEVQLGLLPGAGGVVRTVRMFGIADALMKLLLQGQRLRPAQALKVGLLDEVVPPARSSAAAKAWVERRRRRSPTPSPGT